MEELICYECEKHFNYSSADVYNSPDIIEGQYTEFEAVICPHCGIENRLYW